MPISPALPDPLSDPEVQELLSNFFALLGERHFQACRKCLRRFDETATTPAKNQIYLYCQGILATEENLWDQGEANLLALLQKTLHPTLAMRAWNALAIAVEHLGRLDEAAEIYKRSLDAAQSSAGRLRFSMRWSIRASTLSTPPTTTA